MNRYSNTSRAVSRAASRPQTPPLPLMLLIGSIYGMAAGLTLALLTVAGLLPAAWATAGEPLAFQAFLTSVGALAGALLAAAAPTAKRARG